MPHPIAIKIAGFSDVTDNIKYERGAFEKVIKDNNVGNLPVVVLVVSGPYRSGKSFLLNWFVDRLMEIEKIIIRNSVTSVPQNLKCFRWASGVDRETSGIMICSKIFKVKCLSANSDYYIKFKNNSEVNSNSFKMIRKLSSNT